MFRLVTPRARLVPFFILTVGLLGWGGRLSAQFFSETFDGGLGVFTPASTAMEFSPDGRGAPAVFGAERTPIRSGSGGGAALYNGVGSQGVLQSGEIVLEEAPQPRYYLTFHQYLSTRVGQVRVAVFADNGAALDTVLQLGIVPNGSTSSGSYHQLVLPLEFQGAVSVQITMSLTADVDFWLVDDVQLYASLPPPVTFPRYFGEALTDFGLPFVVDSAGAPAVPFQLVVDLLPGFTEAEYAVFRDMLNATVVRSCACDRLEVWEMPGGVFFDPTTGAPLGDPGEIYGGTLPGRGMNKIDGVNLNYYNYNELDANPNAPTSPLDSTAVAAFPPAPADAVRVAVLDTGLDLDHPDLYGYVFRNADEAADGLDNDGDCLADNFVGWNYVDANNNPADGNSHGTHVAGLVARNLNLCEDCAIQLIPYKTHNNFGVGTLFATACATLQASVYDGADVINASWGFFGGGQTSILRSAIDTAAAYGTLFVAATGNDTLNLAFDPQYPALYDLDEVIAVTAHDTTAAGGTPLGRFANFGDEEADLAAFGTDVTSSVPGGGTGVKSGTSMAAPVVSAAACLYGCEFGTGQPLAARDFILTSATATTALADSVIAGRVFNSEPFCDRPPVSTLDQIGAVADVCFDPLTGSVDVASLRGTGPATFAVFSVAGGLADYAAVRSFPAGARVVLDLSAAPPGPYLLVVGLTGGRTYVRRLVKR